MTKSPFAVMQSPSQKKPRFESGPDPESAFPSWRISLLEMVDPFGWHEIEKNKLGEIRNKLADFESMTWHEILGKNSHLIPVSGISKAARDRLQLLKQDDIDELLSLRLSGKQRIWGILEDQALKVLWWDPEHLVCPSSKKHT